MPCVVGKAKITARKQATPTTALLEPVWESLVRGNVRFSDNVIDCDSNSCLVLPDPRERNANGCPCASDPVPASISAMSLPSKSTRRLARILDLSVHSIQGQRLFHRTHSHQRQEQPLGPGQLAKPMLLIEALRAHIGRIDQKSTDTNLVRHISRPQDSIAKQGAAEPHSLILLINAQHTE